MSDGALGFDFAYGFILCSCGAGFIFGIWNMYLVMSVKTQIDDSMQDNERPFITVEGTKTMNEISEKIQNVSNKN
jgi:hypothetical protein